MTLQQSQAAAETAAISFADTRSRPISTQKIQPIVTAFPARAEWFILPTSACQVPIATQFFGSAQEFFRTNCPPWRFA